MDIWDGPDGDPIVHHGRLPLETNARVLLRDVLLMVRNHGFVASEVYLTSERVS